MEDLKFVCSVLDIMLGFLMMTLALVYITGSYSCSKYEEVTGRPSKYVGFECYVERKGEWNTYEQDKLKQATTGK